MSMMKISGHLAPSRHREMNNLLCVLPHDEERQSRVRSDVRTTLTLGLEAPSTQTVSSGARCAASITQTQALFMPLWVPRGGMATDTFSAALPPTCRFPKQQK